MTKLLKYTIGSILTIILFAEVSCIKNEIDEINGNLVINPEYSFPIGNKELTLGDLVDSHHQALIEIPNPDVVSNDFIFNYDGENYFSPSRLNETVFFTFDFNTLSENFDLANSLMFRVNVVNGIPGGLDIQVYFSNESGTNTSILFTNGWLNIEPARYSNDGESIIPSEQFKQDTYFDKDRIMSFLDKNTIIISLRLSVTNPSDGIIKYLSEQAIKVQFAVRLGLELNTNDI